MRCLRVILILVFGLCSISPWAAAATTDQEVSIFKGDDPPQDGITIGGWGSGSAVKSKEQLLTGGWSIKIMAQSLYSGARIEFAQPVTLFSNGIDNNRYIQFAFFFKDTKVVNPAQGTDYTWSDVDPYTMPIATKVRFVFISDDGMSISTEEPTNPVDSDDGWVRIAVHMAKFKTKEDLTSFRLKKLLIFANMPTTFYLGEMKLLTDTTSIKADPLDPRTIAIMDPQFFVANADGGVSSLKYSWDFNSSNGIQTEASDKVAKYVYMRGGDFTVTLTVSDADGIKDPVTVSTVITVTD